MAKLWLRTAERAAERACLSLSMALNASVQPASEFCAAGVWEAPWCFMSVQRLSAP